VAASEPTRIPGDPARFSAVKRSCSISVLMLSTSEATYVRNSSGVIWSFCFMGGESPMMEQVLKTVHLKDDIMIVRCCTNQKGLEDRSGEIE
jgi:hypothetical protein